MFIIKSIPHHHTTHQQTANITHSRQQSPLPHPTLTTPPPPKPLLPHSHSHPTPISPHYPHTLPISSKNSP